MHPWIRRLLHRRECVQPERTVTPGQRDATAALGRATAALQEIEDQKPSVFAAAHKLRMLREHNHFAEAIDQLYRGGRS